MKRFSHTYDDIISVDNLLQSWQEFVVGKKNRKDVILFQAKLMDNIFSLHNDLKNKTYIHGEYHAFNISDPKPRNIHKATVRDRLLHHAIYRILYPYFDKKFIHDSYSCRLNKGTHKAMNRLRYFYRKISKNNTKTCYVLKCDIKKFFANIDHQILKSILSRAVLDTDILWLLGQVVDSFTSIYAIAEMKKGLPLGNLTSQLLVNIYMNEFDQFVKRELKVKYYVRYADDFVILSENQNDLLLLLRYIVLFLREKLKLELHPKKVFIKTIASGIDFLGWVHYPKHRVLRTTTKRRMLKNVKNNPKPEAIQSYLGMLQHGDTYKIKSNYF
ncbi:MAG: RNA-directed DNA polymerase [Candidatus Nomurabacteria bacterium GW2011_GWF2_43_8]|uniref:RNA-directed DNA polymerase n=1 Tax=Candidatus Nomurabacteria bacterium GW2011_GWF2_43_8 TaxID=1618779 RepID=A0A0G1FLI2_9BACT|nr:MAG: RNA-directed DNA polymerase [Candidatus Nomurabacteria bacterium GW2011_GWF2_43_8]